MEVGAAELAPLEPDHIEPDQDGLRPERKSERNDVAGDAAHAAQHRALADADELVHRGVAADEHMIGDRDMAAEHGAVGEDDVVADVAVVADVRIGHQEAAVADRGDFAVVLGAGADRHAFADLAVAADGQPRGAAAVAGRLRRGAERGKWIDHGLLADHRDAGEIDVRQQPHAGAQFDLRSDRAERTDLDVVGQSGAVGHA